MITRIEIDGFKTFQEFSLDLAPFQVIIGPNGCGKSNLFDAIHLLSRLANHNLPTAFQGLRGTPHEQFTIQPDGPFGTRMHFAIEMLVEPILREVDPGLLGYWKDLVRVADVEFNDTEVKLKHRHLRYEIDIERTRDASGYERLVIAKESLAPLQSAPLFVVERGESGILFGFLDKEGIKRGEASIPIDGFETYIERPFLGRSIAASPYAFAVLKEISRYSILQLSPDAILQSSSSLASASILPDGSNLPNALARMERKDSCFLRDVSRDLAYLIPGLLQVEVEHDEAHEEFAIWTKMQDERRFPARLLSDGTLRLLALATIRNDPEHRGVLCLEQPEDGVHPGQLKRLVHLLRDMTTDLSNTEQTTEPFRQLLVSTHSPEIVSELDVERELLFASMPARLEPGKEPMQVTRIMPVCREVEGNRAAKTYTLAQVLKYLNTSNHESLRSRLRKAHT